MTTKKTATKRKVKSPAKKGSIPKSTVKKSVKNVSSNRSEAAKKAAVTRAANKAKLEAEQQPKVTETPTVEPTEPTDPVVTEENSIEGALAAEVAVLEAEHQQEIEAAEQASQPAPVEYGAAPKLLTENLKPLLGVGFMVLEAKVGEEWKLSVPELDALSQAAANVLAMYLPTETSNNPWVGLGIAVAGIAMPRAAITLMKPKGQKATENQPESTEGGDHAKP